MRILHTADWHLGKRLDFYNRLDEQKQVLAEICEIAKKELVDMVIVAGDLFDTFNPPNEATELLYKTLKKLAQNGKVPVIAIAGNHDSPDRINVADVLARESGIIFIGRPDDEVVKFSLENGFEITQSEIGFIELKLPQISYPVRVLHTAFANEQRLKEFFAEDKQQSLQESLGKKWKYLTDKYADNKGVNLLTTHLYMLKKGGEVLEEPEGEKPLNIGNADVVYSDIIPPQIQYAALGHLHRYQDVGKHQPVIYSSAVLQYSFAEYGQQKYVNIIEIEPDKKAVLKPIALKSGKQLVRQSFDDINNAIAWLRDNQDTLVELTIVSDDFMKAEERKQLYQTHQGIIHLIPKVNKSELLNNNEIEINLDKNVTELFKDYFKSKNSGQEPNDDILNLFKEILAE